jgi:quercetin dioxygenase-like cupin family protein
MTIRSTRDEVPTAYVHLTGAAEQRWLGETSTFFLATGDRTSGAFALVDEQAVQGEAVPLHLHQDDVESFYVLDGEISFFVGDDVMRAGAGSFVHVPGGTVHGFRIESSTARYLILTTARHGEFYRAITDAEPGLAVDGERISRACEEYGIAFVGDLPGGL